MAETISNVFDATDGRPPAVPCVALTVVMRAGDPGMEPSRHLVDDIDVVEFRRGPRAALRDHAGGLRRLVIRVPDPAMSSEHGRMLRVQGRWMLEDPASKNGAVIAGCATRCGVVELGDVIELGGTVFVLDRMPLASGAAPDRSLVGTARNRELASFHPDLVDASEALGVVAPSNLPVLFHGETGTGKEIYARALHELSGRSGSLVAVNCGALSPTLLESELFGHRRGAFSGATADRAGFVRSADRGTLFLDEIGDLSPAGQVALLRVLQEREVVPVGDSLPIPVDVRVCAASHAPLAREVDAGRFRGDLYARLLGYELRLPTLRERRGDIGYLVASLLERLAPERKVALTTRAARALITYDWPRNVRELERCLATALVLARGKAIDLGHLPEPVRAAAASAPNSAPGAPRASNDRKEGQLRDQLVDRLVEHRGNISAVARDLGKHREQVNRMLRSFGIDPRRFRA